MAVNMSVDRGVFARIYKEIKERILSGDLRLSARLDVDDLATRYKVSTTPVRQALAYLSFERLIVSHPTYGYQVMLWSEPALRDLYKWRGTLAREATKTYHWTEDPETLNGSGDYADAVSRLLQRLNGAPSSELSRAAINADERLRAARVVEPEIMPTSEAELRALAHEMSHGTTQTLQAALSTYHQRRVERAADIRAHAILRSLSSDGDE
jgi:DNA-binding transcriptional regulator YhcF (GntR family)